ncbi:MAG: HAD hydrolase family protein [Elusimicrobiaceae bacterium]|nr:HAD hydrolase family protein [Elusimicrobiaceae bacterium]
MDKKITNILKRAKKIKMLLTDVDGVLTDATMNFFTNPNKEMLEVKKFCAYDGLACHMLRDAGIKSAIITGGNAPATEKRAASLGMDFLYYNYLSKGPAFKDILKKTGLKAEEVAYIGDDFIDMPVLLQAGLACAVKTSIPEVKKIAHYITKKEGGRGAFREVAELLLKAQGKWPKTIENAKNGNIGKSPKPTLQVVNYKQK